MSHKRIFILLLILPIILFSISGCAYLQEAGMISPQPEKSQEQRTEAPLPATQKILKISHAPKVGETAEVTLTVIRSFREPITVKAWLEFSRVYGSARYDKLQERAGVAPQEILAQGDLNWEGTATKDTPLEFHTDIKFPEEGIWEITGYIKSERGNPGRSNRIKLAVQTNRAGIYGSEAHRAGKLDWMDDYSPSDYSPDVAVRLDSPVTATLDLSEPPKLNEPTELTWSITSTEGIEEAKFWIKFELWEPGATKPIIFPDEAVLVAGSLQWEGTLEEGVPLSSLATVTFPAEGDWEVELVFDDSESISGYAVVFLNVTEEMGRWGWAESHEVDSSQTLLPTPAPLPGE